MLSWLGGSQSCKEVDTRVREHLHSGAEAACLRTGQLLRSSFGSTIWQRQNTGTAVACGESMQAGLQHLASWGLPAGIFQHNSQWQAAARQLHIHTQADWHCHDKPAAASRSCNCKELAGQAAGQLADSSPH